MILSRNDPIISESIVDIRVSYPGNSGAEGVAYDAANQLFYIVKEQNPMKLYKFSRPVDTNNVTITPEIPFDVEVQLGSVVNDLSAVYYDDMTGRLLLLSHLSHKVIDVALDGILYGELPLADTSQQEGPTMDGNILLNIISEANYYRIYSQ